jgi:hypothetical protein
VRATAHVLGLAPTKGRGVWGCSALVARNPHSWEGDAGGAVRYCLRLPFAHSFLATRVRGSEVASTSLLGAAMPALTSAFEVHGADIHPAPKRSGAYDHRERAHADPHPRA